MQVEEIILQDFHIKNTILSNSKLVKCSSFFEKNLNSIKENSQNIILKTNIVKSVTFCAKFFELI